MKSENCKNLRNIFKKAEGEIVIDPGKKEEALAVIGQEAVSIQSSNYKLCIRQFCYMDKSMLWFQLGGCLILFLAAAFMSRFDVKSEDMLICSAILSALLSVFSLMGISRIFASNLAELSESCYFNVKQMIVFQMIGSGVLNLTALLLVILFTGFRWSLLLVQAGLYILVPYVMTQCGCMGVLLTELGRQNPYIVIAAGILMCVCYSFIASIPGVYQVSSIMFWGLAFAAGMIIWGIQLKILFSAIGKGEMLCMN